MDIKRTINPPAKRQIQAPAKPAAQRPEITNSESFADVYEPGAIGAGITVAGGLISLAGAFADQPLVALGGGAVTLLGAGLSAKKVYDNNGVMNKAAWVSLAAATAVPLASVAILTAPGAAPIGPQGPLPQFLRQIGVKALPF